MTARIWQHTISGERFAVALDSYHQIVGACGPLHHSEITAAKCGDWDVDQDVTADIRANATDYRDVTDRDE